MYVLALERPVAYDISMIGAGIEGQSIAEGRGVPPVRGLNAFYADCRRIVCLCGMRAPETRR